MEFETLYKQTFAQVRCPAHVAVAAQPARGGGLGGSSAWPRRCCWPPVFWRG